VTPGAHAERAKVESRRSELMGRVFDALKRASERNKATPIIGRPKTDGHRNRATRSSDADAENSGSAAKGASASPELADLTSYDMAATLGAPSHAAPEFATYDILGSRVEPHLISVSQPRSPHCEQFRSLRTKLMQAGERLQMRAFVVTSAAVGEGKTLTALNLAWLLAQTDGMRALIIDSDLRKPCVTQYLGIDRREGLSEVLSGAVTLDEAIIKLNPAGLFLLPGGEARDDVAELLSGPAYGRILGSVRKMFDYIIIDAPPLAIFSDANVLMNRADAGLIVIRSRKTRYAMIDKLLEQIPREKLLGIILNRVDEQFDGETYYYTREYYQRDRTISETKLKQLPDEIPEEVAIAN